MPIFECDYRATTKNQHGKNVELPPHVCLQLRGPVLRVLVSPTKEHLAMLGEQGQPGPAPIVGLALIDTGATVTAVDESVCLKLGIAPTGRGKIAHAGGEEVRACYPIQIEFPGAPLPSVTMLRAMSVNLQQFGKTPYILLFGRDLLANMKFIYTGPRGRIELAF